MATSADDLLIAAQAEIYGAARTLPDDRVARSAVATETLQSYLAVWPRLAAAQVHAVQAVPMHPDQRAGFDRVMQQLDLAQRQLPLRNATPDARFARAADLTSAAGDALDATRPLDWQGAPPIGTADRVMESVSTAARLTGIYAEQRRDGAQAGGSARPWLQVAASARAVITTRPDQRTTAESTVPIVAPGEASLAGSLDRWQRAAHEVLGSTATPSARVPDVALRLRQGGGHRRASQGRCHQDAGWPRYSSHPKPAL